VNTKKSIFFIVIFTFLSFLLSANTNVISTFSGSGGKNTRPFVVKQGWEIQWDASGDIFQLYLYTASGELVGVSANQMGPGKGSSYQANAGKYYLQVNAMGRWKINIVQVNSSKNYSSTSSTTSFNGSGAQNTRPFTTNGSWEIQWDATGDIFQLYLYTASGELVGVPANQMGSGKGNSYQPKAGKYYLQVNAIGNWKIKIVPVR